MKNIKLLIAAIIAMPLLFTACKDPDDQGKPYGGFLDNSAYGVYSGNSGIFVYTEQDCQYSVSGTSMMSRVQKDDMSAYVNLEYGTAPVADKNVNVKITVKNVTGLSDGTASLAVLKAISGKVWCWDSVNSKGYIMPWLQAAVSEE